MSAQSTTPPALRVGRTAAEATSARVAGFIRGLERTDVPDEVIERIAWLCLDARACAHAGRMLTGPRVMAEFAAENLAGDRATSLLDGWRLSAPGAALVNGTLMNALDLDDGHPLAKGHPGGVVIPAALAVAELTGANAQEFALSVLIGYEVGIRAAIHQQEWLGNYHSSGSWGAIGAAAAACRLLRLDEDQIENALGLAEYHAPLDLVMNAVVDPAMAKDAMGWGAHVGVSSALLSARGFTATRSTVVAAMAHEEFGATWETDRMYVKPYPCCRWVHPALDAAVSILQMAGLPLLDAAAVESVEICTFDHAAALSVSQPTCSEEAQFNLPWPVACMLSTGRFDVESVTDGVHDPRAAALLPKVHVVVDPGLSSAFPAARRSQVIVTFGDGTRIASGLFTARGDAGDSEWRGIITEKYRQYVSPEFRMDDLSIARLVSPDAQHASADPGAMLSFGVSAREPAVVGD
ncbi:MULTISPECIES: MmgE/PrpD family protein [unclassified Microbacterium]|uniref:MmgE/PrpD family protein n=1 Tax=unclassified Microbacterium TaxID=2609290 RepID=UPI00214BD9DF|nr:MULTISPECIES: MmgE/PrpD family protein [unclassified Microbacterium]MCR2785648.1 MmgE/PrpD family protein [Microbacterium sp. zg.B96]WIM17367.1 MmgE/PrpD family protein [Microbacterium sp. zg-B96]